MTNATFVPQTARRPGATTLRLGRLLLLVGLLLAGLAGGGYYLATQGRTVLPPALADTGGWPSWMRQPKGYPAAEVRTPVPAPAPVDLTGAELAKLRAELLAQRQELDALKQRPLPTPAQPPAAKPAAVVPVRRAPPAPMLYVSHEVQEAPAQPLKAEYTLAPGATKLPCILETAINSDVEGWFTSRISSNVYDTATGRHLLVPQGSTVLAHDQSSTLLYGNERLPTVSLTLAFPDGRSVDLGQAPVTDQQGIAGLGGEVNNHWGRLFGAVFIGGALRGGQQALQSGLAQAGGAGQVASGIGSVASQAGQQRAGRALDTRPTITVQAGQLCNVLLIKPLSLPAMWQ